jgi:glycosyltransferase involved in cell wall biosynthesis
MKIAMSKKPLVTVLTPSFNYAQHISACLSSVRFQSYPCIQHIILDAYSTDETAKIIANFAGTYNLTAEFDKDDGPADALNKGFSKAEGEIFCWLNADDYWLHENVVENAVTALENGSDLVTATGWLVDKYGKFLKHIPEKCLNSLEKELRFHDCILQPATFWRRSFHHHLRNDFKFAFDWALWLDILKAGARFCVRNEEWAAYRWHTVNKTATDPAIRRSEIAQILEETLGHHSIQAYWARAVATGYAISENWNMPKIKHVVNLTNRFMYHLTFRRIFSC